MKEFTLKEVHDLQQDYNFVLQEGPDYKNESAYYMYFSKRKQFDIVVRRMTDGYKVSMFDIIEDKPFIHEYKTYEGLIKKLNKLFDFNHKSIIFQY